MGKWVNCKSCGRRHYLFLNREGLPYFYCPERDEVVWCQGSKRGITIRRNPRTLRFWEKP